MCKWNLFSKKKTKNIKIENNLINYLELTIHMILTDKKKDLIQSPLQ